MAPTAETSAGVAVRAGRRARLLRVTVLGGPELFAHRTVDLLRGMGVDARTAQTPSEGFGAFRARLERVRRGLATDVFFHMSGVRDLKRRQVWLAHLGVPTLMVWIGSDVALHASEVSATVRDRVWHWCVAPWLRDELSEAGIAAEVVRLTPPRIPEDVPALPRSFTVLAYAVDDRGDLYGLDVILELARRRPDIPFLLLAATPNDALPENVSALGWVEDTREVMSRSTLYIRPTSRDGLSNLVLEALASGRHVMWTHPFPGVHVIDSVEAAKVRLDELHRQHVEGRLTPNHEGRAGVLAMFESSSVRADLLQQLTRIMERRWRQPPGVLERWFMRSSLRMLRSALRADRTWA